MDSASRGIWTLYYKDGVINSYVDAGGWPTIYGSDLTDAAGNTVYGYYDTTTGELCENQDDDGVGMVLILMANARSYNCN